MKISTLLSALITLMSLIVNAQQWQWAVTSGKGGGNGLNIVNNSRSGFYVLSTVDDTLAGPFSAQCGGVTRNLIVSYAHNGSIMWQTGISANCEAINADNAGNIYMVGTVYNNGTFCSVNGTSSVVTQQGNGDAFLAKYNDQGNLVWVKTWGIAPAYERPMTIKTDAAGNCWVAGTEFSNINNTIITKLFFTKFNPNGSIIWTHTYFTPAGPSSIDIDSSGNAYLCGAFMDTLTLANHSIVSSQIITIFLAKYDNSGNLLWLNRVGNNTCEALKIKCDSHGYLYFTGRYVGSCNIGGTSLSSSHRMFLAKFDTTGSGIWVKSTAAITGTSLDLDVAGNCYVTGSFSVSCNFNTLNGSTTLSTLKQIDIFLAKYNNTGGISWVLSPSGSSGIQNWSSDIICNSKNEIVLTGQFAKTTIFGNTTLVAGNTPLPDVFVAMVKDSIAGTVTEIQENISPNPLITLYPNPCDDKINICFKQNNSAKNVDITIFDVSGEQIYNLCIPQPVPSEIPLDVKFFSRGIYFIKVTINEKTQTTKIIKP